MTNSNIIPTNNTATIIKIGDKWINVEAWKKVHPGGAACIERFQGQDATEAFQSLHSIEAQKMVDKMKNVEVPISMVQNYVPPTKAALAFREFRSQLTKEGWFKRNWLWDAFYVFAIWVLAIYGTFISYQWPIASAIFIGIAMQQAGWIGHDYVHGRGKIAKFLGIFMGSIINGFSSRWWSDKHNKHHVHTNQMGIDDDIQNDPILHLWIPTPDKDHSLRAYQHVYYHIVYAFLYVSWRIQSIQYAWESKNKIELAIIGANYFWLLCLPLQVSIPSVLIGGFLVAEIVTATHQSEELIDGVSYSFVDDQFKTTRDVEIDVPVGNYLWGGMQFQLEHHLFPTMPKYRYNSLRPLVKDFAKKNGLEYKTSSMIEIWNMNYETMKRFSSTKSN